MMLNDIFYILLLFKQILSKGDLNEQNTKEQTIH